MHVYMNGVAAGLQSAPSWAAKLERVVIVQLDSLLHQLVDVRCLNFGVQPRIVVVITYQDDPKKKIEAGQEHPAR